MHEYFEGWYFKQQNEKETLAVIPAMHIDKKGRKTASLQIITSAFSRGIEFAGDAFYADRKRLLLRVGKNAFSPKGISLNIQEKNLEIAGRLVFSGITKPKYPIMGPFAAVPLMECRHSVVSMRHEVEGSLSINGERLFFERGTGYIEGDRGRSFPRRYFWTQTAFNTQDSLMLSVADITYMGRTFTGIAGLVWFRGKEVRFATYLGAKLVQAEPDSMTVKQGDLTLSVRLLEKRDHALSAPVRGEMNRIIRESASCTVHYRLEERGETVFDFLSARASAENEW